MNSNLSLNTQHHQIIQPGPSRNENLRPKVNSNAGQGSMPSQKQYAPSSPSSPVNSGQQSSQSLPKMPNAGDFFNNFFINTESTTQSVQNWGFWWFTIFGKG
jgi:hypothetical protein